MLGQAKTSESHVCLCQGLQNGWHVVLHTLNCAVPCAGSAGSRQQGANYEHHGRLVPA